MEIITTPTDIILNTQDSAYQINVTNFSGVGPQGPVGPMGPAGTGDSTIAQVLGLQAALDGKAALVHYHVVNDITDFDGTVLTGGSF